MTLMQPGSDGLPQITALGMSVPELKALSVPKTAHLLIWYYFVYYPTSPYCNYFLNERKQVTCRDYFANDWKKAEKLDNDLLLKAAVDKVTKLVTLPEDRFVAAAMKKMEELITLWGDTSIDHENAEKIGKVINGANGTIESYARLKELRDKAHQNRETPRGGGEISLFEDPDNEIAKRT